MLPLPEVYTGFRGIPDPDGAEADDAGHHIRVTGQISDQVPREGDVTIWRPVRPTFAHLGSPEQIRVHLPDLEPPLRAVQVQEAVTRAWPVLRNQPWIHVLAHDSWVENDEMDHTCDHIVIADDEQYTQFSTWRAGIVVVQMRDPVTLVREVHVGALATRVPLRHGEFLQQLEIPVDHFDVDITLNGKRIRPGDDGHFFAHGFFINVDIYPGDSIRGNSSTSELPLAGDEDPHDGHEGAESEYTMDSDLPITEIVESSPHGGSEEEVHPHDADAGASTSSTERGDRVNTSEATIQVSPCSHTSSLVAEVVPRMDSLDTSIGQLECFSVQSTSPVQIHLADHINQVPQMISGPMHKHVTSFEQQQPARPSRILSLDSLVPPAPQEHRLCLPDSGILEELIRPHRIALLPELPEDCPLKSPTWKWFQDHRSSPDFHPIVHIYTDGTAVPDEEIAAWAFAVTSSPVLDDLDERETFHGWLSGSVIRDPNDRHFIGATTLDSTSSEASALFWAILFALGQHHQVEQFVFHFDALNVGFAAVATFGFTDRYPIVAHVRKLMQVLEALIQPWNIFARHVRGHVGHPLNELADTIAGYCRDKTLHDPPACDLRDLFHQDGFALQWLWLLARQRQAGAPVWPPLQHNCLLLPDRAQLSGLPGPLPWTFGYGFSETEEAALILDAQLLTFNVRTLRDPLPAGAQPDTFTIGRHALLEAQFIDLGIDIIGLQETRASTSCRLSTDHYDKFASAARNGQGGLALWISKTKPLGWMGRQPLQYKPEAVVVLLATPDQLLVKWTPCAGQSVLFCIAHAPHKGYDEEAKNGWWDTLRQSICIYGRNSHVICLFDANASLGSIQDERVGALHPEDEDTNGAALRQLLAQADLWLPSTFEGLHTGPSATWFSSAASCPTGTRNDYIAIPSDWRSYNITSSTIPDIDVAQSNVDHVAVLLQLHGPRPLGRARPPAPQVPRIDWSRVRQCKDHLTWAKVFKDLPEPDWLLDVHSHWQVCHTALMERLSALFPKTKSQPRKPYINDETWEIRNRKCALRRQIALRAHLCPRLDLLVPFQVWRDGGQFRTHFLRGLRWLLQCQAAHLRDKPKFADLQRQLRHALQAQRNQYLEQVAAEADKASSDQVYAHLRRAGFRSSRKQGLRPLPCILDADGQPAEDLDTLRYVWRTHFHAIECGRDIDYEALLQLCIHTELTTRVQPDENFLKVLPTLHDLEKAMRSCRAHRAPGSDLLVPELLKNASRWMCHWLAPLFAKCSFYITEPLQWRGGVLHELYKGKGAMNQAQNYRGILVSSHLAKCFHNIFRKKAIQYHIEAASPLQLGGIPHKGVDFASHTLRSFLDLGRRHGRSVGVVFLDVQSAFYRLLRCLAIGPTCTTQELHYLLQTMKIPPCATQALLVAAEQPDAFARIGVPDWLKRFGVVFHSHTWFHLRQDPAVSETLRGTRPGDGWADLLYNVVFGHLLRDIEAEIEDYGVQTALDWNGLRNSHAGPGDETRTSGLNAVWADDLAIMLHHDDPAQLLEVMQQVLALYMDRMARRGLLLNMAPGKSEALILLRGKGSRDLKRQLFHVPKPSMDFSSEVFGPQTISLVPKYKHLGFTVHANCFLIAELRVRVGSANTAFGRLRKVIFHNSGLDLAKRSQLFRACVLSIFFWQGGTWPPMRPSEWRYFHGAFLRLLRRFLSKDTPVHESFHWTETQLCARAGVIPLDAELRCLRLGYYGRLTRHGPDALWALLANAQYWLSFIQADIDWFFANAQSLTFRPPPKSEGGLDFWHTLALEEPRVWTGLIRKARQHCLLQTKSQAEVQFFHNGTLNFLENLGVDLPFNPDIAAASAADPGCFCIPCLAGFSTKTGWAVHTFRKHGRKARARYLAEGTQCAHCLHTFANTHRLYLHLRYSAPCFMALRGRGLCVAPTPGLGSREFSSLDNFALCPYIVAAGPLFDPNRPEAHDFPALSPHEEQLLFDLMNLETSISVEHLDLETLWEHVREVLRAHPVSLEEMTTGLNTWRNFIALEHPRRRLKPHFVAQWLRTIELSLQRCTYQWICPDLVALGHSSRNRPRAKEIFEALLPEHLHIPTPCRGPHFVQPVVVHFYSGRRRAGDFQDEFEKITWPSSWWTPVVLSVDIVLSRQWGDLTSPPARRFWLHQAYIGSLYAFLAGPPCESFSVARERWKSDGYGPRPLRDQDNIWGFRSLLLREALQTYIGNSLLTFILETFLYMWLNQRMAIVEHPEEPDPALHPGAPSIWQLHYMKVLKKFPGVDFVGLMQGHFGAISPKPTRLLACHCPDLASILQANQTCATLPKALTMKKTGGFFATAQLKEYPTGLNRALALACHAVLQQYPAEEPPQQQHTPQQQHIFHLFQSSIGQGEMGPDFAFN